MLLYALSFFMLVRPLLVVALLTANISPRTKVILISGFALALVLLPIAAFWIFGDSGFA